jgi:hypothetical protein
MKYFSTSPAIQMETAEMHRMLRNEETNEDVRNCS